MPKKIFLVEVTAQIPVVADDIQQAERWAEAHIDKCLPKTHADGLRCIARHMNDQMAEDWAKLYPHIVGKVYGEFVTMCCEQWFEQSGQRGKWNDMPWWNEDKKKSDTIKPLAINCKLSKQELKERRERLSPTPRTQDDDEL